MSYFTYRFEITRRKKRFNVFVPSVCKCKPLSRFAKRPTLIDLANTKGLYVQCLYKLEASRIAHKLSWMNRTEQNIYFIDVNCTVSCQIHEYNNKFTNGHNICIHDLTTKS